MEIILYVVMFLFIIVIPIIICAIPGLIISAIIIWFIKKKLIIKDKKLKVLMYVMIILFCGNVSTRIVAPVALAEREKTDDLYIQMKEINDSQRLIGLSKEQVVILLGEPMKQYSTDKENTYRYNAGVIYRETFFTKEGNGYILIINFDETDRVKSTSMKYIP